MLPIRWFTLLGCLSLILSGPAAEPIHIGTRLELFVDDHLVGTTEGEVRRVMLPPEPREVVFTADAPWEGNTSGYYTLFRDGDLYRMIYRGWRHDEKMKAVHPEVTCYAESRDGRHWTKPNLGLFEWEGSKANNIVWLGPASHNFTAFRDANPAAPASARYKALGGMRGGLVAFESPDAIHWKMAREQPVITHGAFDSQNLAFWDAHRGEYRAYWRIFTQKVRAIRTARSKDFMTWTDEADLTYPEGTPNEHLYTNAVQPYFRAPHLLLGFPTRFLPDEGQRVEPVLMSSRDGVRFQRWPDPVIPETAPKDRKGNRSNYMTWGLFQLPGRPREISVYATENYYERTPGRVRRFVYRLDGFVALRGGKSGGTLTTKPLRHGGKALILNYRVPPGGDLRVEVLDVKGQVVGRAQLPVGDVYDTPVNWDQEPEGAIQPVRLRFHVREADVFSFRFSNPPHADPGK